MKTARTIAISALMLFSLTAGLGDGNMRKWLLNQKADASGAVADQSIVFGTKNGGQVIFAVENPDPNDIGTMGVRRWFHLEKAWVLPGPNRVDTLSHQYFMIGS